MGAGWGFVPQRSAEVCYITGKPGGLSGSVCAGSVSAMAGPRLTAEMGQCGERFCGQAQSPP